MNRQRAGYGVGTVAEHNAGYELRGVVARRASVIARKGESNGSNDDGDNGTGGKGCSTGRERAYTENEKDEEKAREMERG